MCLRYQGERVQDNVIMLRNFRVFALIIFDACIFDHNFYLKYSKYHLKTL